MILGSRQAQGVHSEAVRRDPRAVPDRVQGKLLTAGAVMALNLPLTSHPLNRPALPLLPAELGSAVM